MMQLQVNNHFRATSGWVASSRATVGQTTSGRFLLSGHILLNSLIVLTACLAGCSQYSDGRVSKGYHNLTAHFNAYVIARDEMQVVEQSLFKNRDDNYNQPLPVLLPADSVKAQPVKPYLDDIIKMTSIVAERHQNSKWVDDSYLLLGKARLYKQDFANAIEVFKYVNTKGTDEDAKHAALVQLMRAYAELNDFANGLNVAEYLRVQPLNEANTRDFYLTKAYLHQRKEEPLIAAAILDAVFPLLKKGEATARLHLIAGQQYDLANQPAKAAEHYGKVLQNRPSYDQSFYASLFLIQSADPKIVAKSGVSFERMLNDRKNADLKDKIYFTMGRLEARRGRIDPALLLYRESVTATTKNTEQVPYTYLEMAKLYFEKKQNYEAAKAYYDSALALLPQKSADFTAISTRKKTLDEFVQHLTTIQTEDSLQRLTKLSPADLDKVLDAELIRREKEDAKQAELARQVIEKATGTPTTAGLTMPGATNSDLNPAERWILYNVVQLTQSKQEFQQRWGNRPLEDDWRRSTKETALPQNSQVSSVPNPAVPSAGTPTGNGTVGGVNGAGGGTVIGPMAPTKQEQKAIMLAKLPTKPEALLASNQRLEEAYYRLGKLYKFQLNQPKEAIETFETLLTQFPNTVQKPEVYYLLHVTNEQLGRSSGYKDKLLTEFPNTSYARLANRAAAAGNETSAGRESMALKAYTDLYAVYQSGNYTEALARAETTLGTYTGTQIEDKLALLRTILVGRVQGGVAYRQALTEFVRDYPASPLLSHVKELQAAAEQPTAKSK